MNILANLFSSSYQELWKAIIRPYRDDYSDKDLGPQKFRLNNKYYKRSDFTLINDRNIKLMCSFWEPYEEEREYPRLPCVVYLHGNSSSRCEVVPNLKYLLPLNITVFAFDFTGCGRSEGEYISLGWYETLDIECVINFLRSSNKVSTIGLWGRSMGAVTSIMYASKDQTIAGIFLDSPFYSLNLLIDELSKEKVSLPNFLVRQVIKMLKQTVKDKAEFNIDDIEPGEYAKKCFVPGFFCHGKDDSFVNVHHCNDLYLLYPGEKTILLVEGDHNTLRPNKLNENASEFFYNALKCKYLREINNYYNGYKMEFKQTPMGNNEVKVRIKNMSYRNYGEAIPIENNEDYDGQKTNYKKINNYKSNEIKYKFRNNKNNGFNNNSNIIKKNTNNISSNKIKYNVNNTFQPTENYTNYKKTVFRQVLSSPKDSYNFNTYIRSKQDLSQTQIINNSTNSKIVEYPKYIRTDLNYENKIYEDPNNSNKNEKDNIYNNSSKQIYKIVNYNATVIPGEPQLRKIQIINQNKVLRENISPQKNIKFPVPSIISQGEILQNANIKTESPTYYLNEKYNNQKNVNFGQLNNNNSDKTLSNNIYYNENNLQMNSVNGGTYMNNYDIYNNKTNDIPVEQNKSYQ